MDYVEVRLWEDAEQAGDIWNGWPDSEGTTLRLPRGPSNYLAVELTVLVSLNVLASRSLRAGHCTYVVTLFSLALLDFWDNLFFLYSLIQYHFSRQCTALPDPLLMVFYDPFFLLSSYSCSNLFLITTGRRPGRTNSGFFILFTNLNLCLDIHGQLGLKDFVRDSLHPLLAICYISYLIVGLYVCW